MTGVTQFRTRWLRPAVVLVTAAASAAAFASLTAPAASAHGTKELPDRLVVTRALDAEVLAGGLPTAAPGGQAAGFARQGRTFTVVVESRLGTGVAQRRVPVGQDTLIRLSATAAGPALAGSFGAVTSGVLKRGSSLLTISGVTWSQAENLVITASGPARSGLAPDGISVTVAHQATYLRGGAAAGAKVDLSGCDATPTTPTCVTLVLADGAVGPILLSSSPCAGFDAEITCRTNNQGNAQRLIQAYVDLDPARYSITNPATAIVSCDKTLCGNGGVTKFPLHLDLGNTGDFTTPEACPAKGRIGASQIIRAPDGAKIGHACMDYRQSSRDNAGDLFTYLLFDYDARMIH